MPTQRESLVNAEEGETRPKREPLTRERIIETALRIMDDEGLEAVTMRRIGRELGVEAMSLYNHVEDKEDILDGVVTLVMGKFALSEATSDWRADARDAALEWRRVLRMHPSVIRLLAERDKPIENVDAMRPMETALDIIRRAGVSVRDAVQAFHAFGGYIMGFVMMEQGLMLGREQPDPEQILAQQQLAEALQAGGFPRLIEALPYFMECGADQQFEYGLDLMIRGLEARAAARSSD
jgi:AcrR family transcriptional regulator